MSEHEPLSFHDVSRRVVARLFVVQWFRCLGLSAVAVYIVAAALAIRTGVVLASGTWVYGVWWPSPAVVAGLIVLWVAAAGLWAWIRRPSPEVAMARWDEGAGRQEMFVSAYCFEGQSYDAGDDDGERLHLDRARRRLSEDLHGLRGDLPVRSPHYRWLLPTALLMLVGAGSLAIVSTSPAEEAALDEEVRARAKAEADTLVDELKVL